MVKSWTRKKSKRMPARKRFKIERKVREHKRKVRKEAKAKGNSKKLKKDPGIPNLYPFKEQLLKQMEERKQKSEEEKVRRREQAKRRSLQGLQNDAQKRAREFEKKRELESELSAAAPSEGLDTQQSLRAYYREFRKVVEASDVVLEVLDARDPLGTRCPRVEQDILASGTNKKLILLINKIDLVPREIVELWLKHLRNEFPTVAFKASTQTQKHNLSQKKLGLGTGPGRLMGSSACLGAEVLLKLLGNYCRNADIRTSITVGVVGLPNVGKSSVINSLKRSRACTVGATPGVTRSMQEIQLDKHVKLLDSPGIVMATGSGDPASVVLRNCIKVESLPDPITPVEAILRRCNRLQVMEHYIIPEFTDVQEFLSHLAKKTGKLKKGGIPDVDAAARSVLRDWNTGRITFYTHPPDQQSLPTHISAEIVKEWGAAFDMKSLEEEEKNDLSGLQNKKEEMMVIESSGPVGEVFGGDGEDEDEGEREDGDEGSEEESEGIEEEMVSESEEGSQEEMEGEEEPDQAKDMTVLLPKKAFKIATPAVTRREAKEATKLQELNPRANTKLRKKAQKMEQKRRQELRVNQAQLDKDDDVCMEKDDTYNFDEYF